MSFAAILVLHKAPSASEYTISTLIPKINMNSLVGISAISMAYTGAEITSNFASEMENPKKDYPRAILVSAVLVCVLYITGSVAMTMLMPTSEIFAYTGTLDALKTDSLLNENLPKTIHKGGAGRKAQHHFLPQTVCVRHITLITAQRQDSDYTDFLIKSLKSFAIICLAFSSKYTA